MTRNVLVTGGAGYVGSHACKALFLAGYNPVTFDNLERGHHWAVKWGPLVRGSLSSTVDLDSCLKEYKPIAVMHFAALAYVGESVADPYRYYQNNVAGTLNLLDAMQKNLVDKLVFSSTCATYGISQSIPIQETAPQFPINPYGASKLMIERVLQDARVLGLRSVVLRYFNAAGADQDCEIGECHIPETHLIPLILDVALGKRNSISIYGDDYDTPDGTCIRDYIHVADLVDAHVLALRHLLDGGASLSLNLGNGAGYSVKQVIETARRVPGHSIPVTIEPKRLGDPPILVGDSALARKLLGWNPSRADLEVQISDAWRWHCNLDQYATNSLK